MITISKYGSETFQNGVIDFLLIFEHNFTYDDKEVLRFSYFSMSNYLRLVIAKNKCDQNLINFIKAQYRFDLDHSISAMNGLELLKAYSLSGNTVQLICDADVLFSTCSVVVADYLRANGLAVEIRGGDD